jgi:predicted RNase H-like HicB family nuclease
LTTISHKCKFKPVPAHDEILRAALRLCRRRGGWRFRPVEIVRALPHLEPGTIRTHIVSRCCVNAPKNHPHRWDYFERVGRGLYEIRRPYRKRPAVVKPVAAEPTASWNASADGSLGETVHAVVRRSRSWYVAECLEIGVVTQARTLDELVDHLREAIGLHLEGENAAALGIVAAPRLALTYELPATAT